MTSNSSPSLFLKLIYKTTTQKKKMEAKLLIGGSVALVLKISWTLRPEQPSGWDEGCLAKAVLFFISLLACFFSFLSFCPRATAHGLCALFISYTEGCTTHDPSKCKHECCVWGIFRDSRPVDERRKGYVYVFTHPETPLHDTSLQAVPHPRLTSGLRAWISHIESLCGVMIKVPD